MTIFPHKSFLYFWLFPSDKFLLIEFGGGGINGYNQIRAMEIRVSDCSQERSYTTIYSLQNWSSYWTLLNIDYYCIFKSFDRKKNELFLNYYCSRIFKLMFISIINKLHISYNVNYLLIFLPIISPSDSKFWRIHMNSLIYQAC